MVKKSKEQLDKEIMKLLDRSEELFHRHRSALDQDVVRPGEFDSIVKESKRLIDELKHLDESETDPDTSHRKSARPPK